MNYTDPDGCYIIFLTDDGRQLRYMKGELYWVKDNKYNVGKKYDGKGGNETINKVLKAYQAIEKSNNKVLKGELHTLETTKDKHYVGAGKENETDVATDSYGSVKDGDKMGTVTTFNLSDKEKEGLEKASRVKSTDLDIVSHELRHQFDFEIGNMKDNTGKPNAKNPAEIRAVNNENRARKIENAKFRTTYGGVEINTKLLNKPPNNKLPQ